MNITLIQPFTDNLEPPLSLAFLAGPLKDKGHSVRLIDMQIPEVRRTWESVYSSAPSDMVGITAMTPQIKQAHDIALRIKALSPGVPVIAGGAHPSLLPEQTLLEFPAFDLIAIGEGETTIVALAARLEQGLPMADASVKGIGYLSGGKPMLTAPNPRILELDRLANPHEHYDFGFYLDNNSFSFTDKSISMIISRGCPFSCKFCATKSFWTRKYIYMSTDRVISEIRHVMGRGARGVVFRDSTFNVNKKWVTEFCEKLLKEGIRFKWAMNARVDLVDYDSFSLMKKAGLDTVYFGVESGSQKMLDFYGKEVTLAQIEKAFEVCRKLKIHTGAYFMLGALPETREDMDLTYRFVKKLRPTFSLVFIFMPLPGSELYQYYIDRGFKFDYSNIRSDKAQFESAGLKLDELEAIRKSWYRDFNRKPNLLIRGTRNVLGIRSIKDLESVWMKLASRLPFASANNRKKAG